MTARNEDEIKASKFQSACRAGGEGHSAQNAASVLAEEEIRIVLEGLRGDDSIAELCRKKGIIASLYYTWSKAFMKAGKRRFAGDTARSATTDEVNGLRREARDLKEVVAEQTLGLRLLKKA